MTEEILTGHVAKLLSDEELILTLGAEDGVRKGMTFQILDPRARDIVDPVTRKPLGSIDRIIATVEVNQVGDRISIAERIPRRTLGFNATVNIFAGLPERDSTLREDHWPEGVRVGHIVRSKPRKPLPSKEDKPLPSGGPE